MALYKAIALYLYL